MNRRSVLALSAAAAMALTACGGGQQSTTSSGPSASGGGGKVPCEVTENTRLSIATGNTTGVYYALGGAYAEVLPKATGGKVKATAAETGASVQNIDQPSAGDYQVAFALADTASDAVAGKGAFNKKMPIRALARVHTNYTQVVVRKDANIRTVADLKGKVVSTGSPKSGTEVIANRLLTAAGLDPASDITAQRLDLTKSVDGMKDGSIDALVWSGGLPTPGLTDLFTTAGDQVELLDTSAELQAMRKINEAYAAGSIPAETYKTATPTETIVVPNLLLVRDDMDPNLACVLTKTLLAEVPALSKVSAAAKVITPQEARETGMVQVAEGAGQALDEAARS